MLLRAAICSATPPLLATMAFHFVVCNGVKVLGGQLVPSVNKAFSVTMSPASCKSFVTLLSVFVQNHQIGTFYA